jgi:pimeloyl-ACP methyl ester carboxylesterase/DNA-binding SARP family transcriptional activator
MATPESQLLVLGELSVVRDGKPLALPRSKRARALLAYLALTPRRHRRDRLCAMFWELPDDPRAALRWSLSRLRPLVDTAGRPCIVADRDTVGFDREQVGIDLLALRQGVADGLETLPTARLIALAATCRGELLEGLELPDCDEFQAWCLAEREEARSLQGRVLAALIDRLASTPDQALPYARLWAQIEPESPEARARVMTLVRSPGQRRGVVVPLPVASSPPASRAQQIRFCRTSDGVRIAYAKVGSGPPLVRATHWLNHVEFERESPVWRHWTEAFASDHTFIRYDDRGSGLSDWDVPKLDFEGFVKDLEAVVDALGLDRFPLIGSSKGGPIAIAYAARHPERVSRLILLGTLAKGWRKRGDPRVIARREAMIALMRDGWAQDNPAFRQMFTTRFMPDATPEAAQWFNDLQLRSSSIDNAIRVQEAMGQVDVTDLLPLIRAPTLVLHVRDDGSVPYENGLVLAGGIPDARFVTLEGRNHILLPHDPAWGKFVSELRAFLAEERMAPPAPSRVERLRKLEI